MAKSNTRRPNQGPTREEQAIAAVRDVERRLGECHGPELDALEAFTEEFASLLAGWEMRLHELREDDE